MNYRESLLLEYAQLQRRLSETHTHLVLLQHMKYQHNIDVETKYMRIKQEETSRRLYEIEDILSKEEYMKDVIHEGPLLPKEYSEQ